MTLYENHGHDTLLDEHGRKYHSYCLAIVLKHGDRELALLYENQLPKSFAFKPNDVVSIDGLESARYDEIWKGYWLHDLRLHSVPTRENNRTRN